MFYLIAGLLRAQNSAGDINPMANNPDAVTVGQRIYAQTCQSCHGGEARGDRGPALTAATLPHGSGDGDLFRNIRNGIAGSGMPSFSALEPDQIWQVISYLRSLRGPAAAPDERVPGDQGAGEALFFGKAGCSNCHQVNARGGIVGPDLSAAGKSTAEALRQKITDPNAVSGGRGPRRPGVVVVKTTDGREIRGSRKTEDTYHLQMVDLSGKLLLLDKARIADQRYEFKSLMPEDYSKRLTPAEIQNVVAYLKTLKARDLAKTVQAEIPGGLPYDRLKNSKAEPQNWLTYWGDYQGSHFSALKQITPANVRQLQARWSAQLVGPSSLEATPLVVDGILYTTGSGGTVVAMDARTGLPIWRYQRQQKVVNPYEINPFNRGVAVLGNRVFFGTLDAALVALDARTGLPLWEVQIADTMKGYSLTSAPLALKDKIIVGVTGGEFGAPGFLDAYDPATGRRLWRFHTVPQPGEFGHDTWAGDSWKRGGAPTWLTGSYDPESNTLYWTVGNPGPDSDAEIRKGDNLFSSSVIALDPDTGERKWHYQFTPGDSHDWDATEDVALVDRVFHGQNRKLLLEANRNGFFYVLDRATGKFLRATPFVRQNWNAGFDGEGRPKIVPGTDATPDGANVYPSGIGGNNWRATSYDPATGWMYVVFSDSGQRYYRTPEEYEAGKQYWSGRATPIPGESGTSGVMAIDVETGAVKWRSRIAQASLGGGVLATAGGLVFAATGDGNLIALDSKTGAQIWHFQTGANIGASPMSYSVDGQQFVAISAGSVLYSFAVPK